MSLNYKLIGRRIKEARSQKQMSQAELAEQTDMSASYISLIETGKKKASLESLVRIANALSVTVDYMLSGNQTNNPSEYQEDMILLLEGCTSYEKRIIYEIASATKKSLRDNKCLQSEGEHLCK